MKLYAGPVYSAIFVQAPDNVIDGFNVVSHCTKAGILEKSSRGRDGDELLGVGGTNCLCLVHTDSVLSDSANLLWFLTLPVVFSLLYTSSAI